MSEFQGNLSNRWQLWDSANPGNPPNRSFSLNQNGDIALKTSKTPLQPNLYIVALFFLQGSQLFSPWPRWWWAPARPCHEHRLLRRWTSTSGSVMCLCLRRSSSTPSLTTMLTIVSKRRPRWRPTSSALRWGNHSHHALASADNNAGLWGLGGWVMSMSFKHRAGTSCWQASIPLTFSKTMNLYRA